MSSDFQPAGCPGKIKELRAKTDRDLALLLRRTIERSFEALARADYREAETGHAQAARLLLLAQDLPAGELRGWSSQVAGLRAQLDAAMCVGQAKAS